MRAQVPADRIGLVIGRQGATIKEIGGSFLSLARSARLGHMRAASMLHAPGSVCPRVVPASPPRFILANAHLREGAQLRARGARRRAAVRRERVG